MDPHFNELWKDQEILGTEKFIWYNNIWRVCNLLLILIIEHRSHARLPKLSGLLKQFLQIISLMCDYSRFYIGNLNFFSIWIIFVMNMNNLLHPTE